MRAVIRCAHRAGGITYKIRAQSRVPIATGVARDRKLTQVQYLDVGMSIDCRVQDLDEASCIGFVVDFSSPAPGQTSNAALGHQPVIARVSTQTIAIVEPGRPTLLSRTDEPGSKRTYELEVTATKLQ